MRRPLRLDRALDRDSKTDRTSAFTRRIHAHIVHRPTIHCDRANPLRCNLGARVECPLHAGHNQFEVPVQSPVDLSRIIRKTVHQLQSTPGLLPAQQRDPAALRTRDRQRSRLFGHWAPASSWRTLSWLSSSQICLGQSSVNRENVAGRAASMWSRQEKNCLRAILRIDRLCVRVRLGIKLRQHIAQPIVGARLIVGQLVLLQPSDARDRAETSSIPSPPSPG